MIYRWAQRFAVTSFVISAALGMGLVSARADNGPRNAAAPAQSASAVPSNLPPQAPVGGEIIVMLATNGDGGIDPQIGVLPQLRLPPFSAYNTYKLLARHPVTWALRQSQSVKLPNGRILKTSLTTVDANQRHRVSASISRPDVDAGERSFLPLLEVTARSGETFFVAGQSYQGGVLVVGIRVGR